MQAFFTQGQEVTAERSIVPDRPAAVPGRARPGQGQRGQGPGAIARRAARSDTLRQTGRQRLPDPAELRGPAGDGSAVAGRGAGRPGGDRNGSSSICGFTAIRSPISGRTGALLVDPGNYVQASTGTPLVSITQVKPIYVTSPCRRRTWTRSARARPTHPLEVDAFASDGKTLLGKGTLSFIDNHVDTTTGTIALKGTFANADERLWPGEFVNARLILSVRHNAVTVPAQTVMAGPNGDYVYVIRPDDTVQRRTVQLASQQDGTCGDRQGPCRRREGGRRRPIPAGQQRQGEDRGALRRHQPPPASRPADPAMSISEIFIRRPIATALLMAGILVFGMASLHAAADRRAAERRFPDHRGLGDVARRQPADHGRFGCHAAGAAVRRHPRPGADVVHQRARDDLHHAAVRSGARHRRRGRGRADRDQRGERAAAERPALAADIQENQSGGPGDPDLRCQIRRDADPGHRPIRLQRARPSRCRA